MLEHLDLNEVPIGYTRWLTENVPQAITGWKKKFFVSGGHILTQRVRSRWATPYIIFGCGQNGNVEHVP